MKARITRLLPVTLAVALIITYVARTVRAQSRFDGFDLMLDGTVYASVVQSDGKILIGGAFTHVLGVARNYIARINPDGTLDTTFNPNANNFVYAIALQADGKILVGGGFQGTFSIGGQTRNKIARLDPTTGTADSFNPNAGPVSSTVTCIAVGKDGKILIGGTFTNVGGQGRNKIASLDATTGLPDGFDPNPHSSGVNEQFTEVDAIAVQQDGKILAGGFFETIDGQARNNLARLDANGLADSFNANVDPHQPVSTIALQVDGKILVGGRFENIGGQARRFIARLDAITALADSFNPNANSPVTVITLQPDGKILVGGSFFGANSIGGQERWLIARLDPITGLADSFDPNANQAQCCFAPYVRVIAVQADGKVLIGGDFLGLAPYHGPQVTRIFFARLEKDGRVEQTLFQSINGDVYATAVQPDGKMVIGGSFDYVAGVEHHNIVRLNTDGSLDLAFDPNASSQVGSVALQPDGKILVGGGFTTIGGQSRRGIARLDPATGLADSFNPNANSSISSMAVQSDGKILVGGNFTTIGGQQRFHIARLDPKTGLADSFDARTTEGGLILAVQPDGKIWVGGGFIGVAEHQRAYLAKLDPITGLTDPFNALMVGPVTGLVQAGENVVVAGSFTGAGGQLRNHIARLNGTTGVADSFDPNIDSSVTSMAAQANGKILVGGGFNAIGSLVRRSIGRIDPVTGLADSYDPTLPALNSIAISSDGKALAGVSGMYFGLIRISNNEAALQELSATRTGVTWMRSGSSVVFERATFEYSTDNVNYTFLGDGELTGSDWKLTDLDLPNAQNFYIRARGFYRSGQHNKSESIEESVRNVFLHAVSVANIVSRKVHGAAGTFDINLPQTIGTPGVECRSGGVNGDYQLVFSFANPVTSVGDASVTNGTGNIASRMIDTDAHNYIVNLTGVTNAQIINVSLTNVNDNAGNSSSSISVPMAVLIGDVNGNGTVSASDIAQTKTNSGASIDATNFRSDTNANGSINASDVTLVKSNSGTGISSQAPFKGKTL